MPLLSAPLRLHHLEDAEALCRQVLGRFSGHLERTDYLECLVYLVETCWELSVSYDPSRDQRRDFASYAGRILDRRVYDWLRAQRGRTRWTFGDGTVYERERPVVLSLDAPTGDPELDPLGETLADWSGDPQANRGPAFDGLLVGGDQQRDRDLELLRAMDARRARERDQQRRERERARRLAVTDS